MKKMLYFFIKNNTLPLFIISCLAFLLATLLSLAFSVPELYPLRFINGGYAAFTLFLCIFYGKIGRMVSMTLFSLAIITYSILEPLTARLSCNSEFYLLCGIPAIFLLTAEYKKPRWYPWVMNSLISLCLIFLLYYRFSRTVPADLLVAELRRFYILTKYSASFFSITVMTYAGFNTLVILHHFDHKTRFLQSELETMAKHDVLTSLINRREAMARFEACEEKKIRDGSEYAICIFDIDNFKGINDQYGHDAGDFILRTFSQSVKNACPPPAEVARWGGEEFLIIFPEISGTTIYELDRIRKRIAEKPIRYKENDILVTATYGISSSRLHTQASEVLADADHMLLEGKNNGKNRLVVSEKF